MIYCVLSDGTDDGEAFGIIAEVEARSPKQAVLKAMGEMAWGAADGERFVAVPARYFSRFYVLDGEGRVMPSA